MSKPKNSRRSHRPLVHELFQKLVAKWRAYEPRPRNAAELSQQLVRMGGHMLFAALLLVLCSLALSPFDNTVAEGFECSGATLEVLSMAVLLLAVYLRNPERMASLIIDEKLKHDVAEEAREIALVSEIYGKCLVFPGQDPLRTATENCIGSIRMLSLGRSCPSVDEYVKLIRACQNRGDIEGCLPVLKDLSREAHDLESIWQASFHGMLSPRKLSAASGEREIEELARMCGVGYMLDAYYHGVPAEDIVGKWY